MHMQYYMREFADALSVLDFSADSNRALPALQFVVALGWHTFVLSIVLARRHIERKTLSVGSCLPLRERAFVLCMLAEWSQNSIRRSDDRSVVCAHVSDNVAET
jgi:hypothetical protein